MLSPARRLELRTLSHLPRTRPHFMSFYFRELPWAPIEAYRVAGFPVISWTIRTPDDAKEAMRHTDQITFENFAA
jgi:glycerophosphoryl diester phosphodiesterase